MKNPGGENLVRSCCILSVKCSATLASVAAPPSGARQVFGGADYPRHPSQVSSATPAHRCKSQDKCHRGVQDGERQGLWGGGGCDIPATHSAERAAPGVWLYTLERRQGGVASAPLRLYLWQSGCWSRVPSTPGANPLVAERAFPASDYWVAQGLPGVQKK